MAKFTIDPEYMEKYKDAEWIETHTGRRFFPACPRAEDLTIFDIAHALSMKCRYNGHTKQFYSVAEHCTALALFARHRGYPVDVQLQFLMHDGNEAYLPDVCRPIKHFFPDLIIMEKNLDAMIRAWVDLDQEVPAVVKQWDSRIIRDERAQVMMPSALPWKTDALDILGVQLQAFEPAEAETRFLKVFQALTREHLGRPVLLAWDDGKFAAGAGSDQKDFRGLNVRLLDLLGKCALCMGSDGPHYVDGDFEMMYDGLTGRI